MRALRILLCLITVLSIAAFAGSIYYTMFYLDTVPPEIQMDADRITISVKDGDDVLLAGVTAWDSRDGDVSGELIVSGTSQLTGKNTARVSYMAFDRAGNAATASRTVCYTDYEAPRFHLLQPLVFSPGQTVELKGRLVARDSLDGNITSSIRLLSSSTLNTVVEGTYHLDLRVMNRMGDTATVTLPVIIRNASSETPRIELSTYLLYLDQGAAFDPQAYFSALYENAAAKLSGRYADLTVTNGVDTQTPGTYEVRYAYTNASGHSTETILTVVVETMEDPT